MNNEYFDVAPTRGNLRLTTAQFTGNAFADFLLGYVQRAQLTNVFVVNQRLWSTSFFVQDDWKVERRADGEPRPPLRLHRRRPTRRTTTWRTSTRPAPARWCSPPTDRSRIARSSSRTRTTSRRASASSTSWASARSFAAATACSTTSSSAPGRRTSSRSTRPGCATSTLSARGRGHDPVLFMRDGFPANFLDHSQLVIGNLMLRSADSNAPRTMVQQFGGGIERQLGDELRGLGRRHRLVDRPPRGHAQPQSAAAGHARRQRAARRIPRSAATSSGAR